MQGADISPPYFVFFYESFQNVKKQANTDILGITMTFISRK